MLYETASRASYSLLQIKPFSYVLIVQMVYYILIDYQ